MKRRLRPRIVARETGQEQKPPHVRHALIGLNVKKYDFTRAMSAMRTPVQRDAHQEPGREKILHRRLHRQRGEDTPPCSTTRRKRLPGQLMAKPYGRKLSTASRRTLSITPMPPAVPCLSKSYGALICSYRAYHSLVLRRQWDRRELLHTNDDGLQSGQKQMFTRAEVKSKTLLRKDQRWSTGERPGKSRQNAGENFPILWRKESHLQSRCDKDRLRARKLGRQSVWEERHR